MQKIFATVLVLVGVVAVISVLQSPHVEVPNNVVTSTENISITEPLPNQEVSSPLTVRGEARGMWYFEANFPIRIEDANGNVLLEHYATAEGDWMTEGFVPFSAELTFDTPSTATGTLVLERANPSGLPEHADELRIPVQFSADSQTDTSSIEESFQFPDDLDKTYISIVDWPPQVEILEKAYQCSDAGVETDRAGRTEERSVNGQTFCATTVAEGAAGSVYRQYAYIFPYKDQSVSFTFSLRFPQCANYDQPKQSDCLAEQESLDLDALMQAVFASTSAL